MSIRGIGIDLLKIERIIKPFESPRFRERVFTQAEVAYILRGKNPKYESAAGFFCAKEAVMKALGVGFPGISFNEIEVLHRNGGAPYIVLHGRAAALLGNRIIFITITHTEDTAAAFAVLEGDE